MTDTTRTATEQLLISCAVDQALSQLDFRPLTGKPVFCDAQYLEGTVDRGYVISTIRQQLLATGCILQDDRAKATYVVELRSGGIGTDHHSLLVGVPQMTVPTFLPGQPSQIPEIPVAKKTDEQGVAKIAVFAYNRLTGQRVWQSGTVEGVSDARDFWIAGMGPFRAGTILHGTELAGEQLPNPLHLDKQTDNQKATTLVPPMTCAAVWSEPAKPVIAILPTPPSEKKSQAVASSGNTSGADKQGGSPASGKEESKAGSSPAVILHVVGQAEATPSSAGSVAKPNG
jgi:hypothetical protein